MEKKISLIFGLFIIATILCAFIPVNVAALSADETSSGYVPVGGELTSGGITVMEGLMLATLVVAFVAGTVLVARKLK